MKLLVVNWLGFIPFAGLGRLCLSSKAVTCHQAKDKKLPADMGSFFLRFSILNRFTQSPFFHVRKGLSGTIKQEALMIRARLACSYSAGNRRACAQAARDF